MDRQEEIECKYESLRRAAQKLNRAMSSYVIVAVICHRVSKGEIGRSGWSEYFCLMTPYQLVSWNIPYHSAGVIEIDRVKVRNGTQ